MAGWGKGDYALSPRDDLVVSIRAFSRVSYELVRCLVLEIGPTMHKVQHAVKRGEPVVHLVTDEHHHQLRHKLMTTLDEFDRRLREMRGAFFAYVVEHEQTSMTDLAAGVGLRRQTVAGLIYRDRGR